MKLVLQVKFDGTNYIVDVAPNANVSAALAAVAKVAREQGVDIEQAVSRPAEVIDQYLVPPPRKEPDAEFN